MRSNKIIRKIFSSLLICILALGLTPKIILHNFLADHKDSCFDNHSIKGSQLTKAGFNCNFENLVAESPFIYERINIEAILSEAFPFYIDIIQTDHLTQLSYFHELRGPPIKA